jgi:hypothetical protein
LQVRLGDPSSVVCPQAEAGLVGGELFRPATLLPWGRPMTPLSMVSWPLLLAPAYGVDITNGPACRA